MESAGCTQSDGRTPASAGRSRSYSLIMRFVALTVCAIPRDRAWCSSPPGWSAPCSPGSCGGSGRGRSAA